MARVTTVERAVLETQQPAATVSTREEHDTDGVIRRCRNRLSDIDDATWADLLGRLRAREPLPSLVRTILDKGLCAHLEPGTIQNELGKVRAALGIRVSKEQTDEEEAADQPIEAGDAFQKQCWLTRIQTSRVKKGVRLEGTMGIVLFPQATKEIKVLLKLLVKEEKLARKIGKRKATPDEAIAAPETAGQFFFTPEAARRVVTVIENAFRARGKKKAGDDAPGGKAGDPTGQ